MIHGKLKSQNSNKIKNNISSISSKNTPKTSNLNSLRTKQEKTKATKINTNYPLKTDSSKKVKTRKIIHRNNKSMNFDITNPLNNEISFKSFEQSNNNITDLFLNPIALGTEEKISLFKKENHKKNLKKNILLQQKENKKFSNSKKKNNNNNNNIINKSKKILNLHKCKSESNFKKIEIFSPTFYGYKITFPNNLNKSQSNDSFSNRKTENIEFDNKQKILSVKIVYYLNYIDNIILIQKTFRGFLLRNKRFILNEKINNFSNHICFAILIHANLSKKYFFQALKSYRKNKIYSNPLKSSFKKNKSKNLDFKKCFYLNKSVNNEEEGINNLIKSDKKEKKIDNNILHGLHRKNLSQYFNSNNTSFANTFEFERLSSKRIKKTLKIQNVHNFGLKSKNKPKEPFSKYKQLYMIAMKQTEKLQNKLNQPQKFKEPLKIKSKVNNISYIPKKKNNITKINEFNFTNKNNNAININKNQEIEKNNIKNMNNLDDNISSNQIQNNTKTYNQSTYFIVDKNNSNSSPTVITINNTLSSNRKRKIFNDIIQESQNINFKLESVFLKKHYSIDKLFSYFIQSNQISSFKSLSIIKEKEDYIKSNKSKQFYNLGINHEIFDLSSLCKINKTFNDIESNINFSVIDNKKIIRIELNKLDNFSIKSINKKQIFDIEPSKYFFINNNEKRRFKNITESNFQFINFKPVKIENKNILNIKKEIDFKIEFDKKELKKNILEINSNNQFHLISNKNHIVLNTQNKIINYNFELIPKNKKIIINNQQNNIFEEVISFNIIENNKKDKNMFMISHTNFDYYPRKRKQNKNIIFMNKIMKMEWTFLPNQIVKYIKNYNKLYTFQTLIEYMNTVKNKNKINLKGKNLLIKIIKKTDFQFKNNYFNEYKEKIKIEKIIEKCLDKKKENIINNIKIESTVNFSIDKKFPEEELKFSNELILKSTNQEDNIKLKNELLPVPNLHLQNVSKNSSKKIVSLKNLKGKNTKRTDKKIEEKKNTEIKNPVNSNRIILKRKPINIVSDIKNSYIENLLKIKKNQIKKKYLTLWKNNINLNELFTFRSKDEKLKKQKRQLRIKYIKKNNRDNISKENSLNSNSSKGYKQMKIIHKIFDGSGEITSINNSHSSKFSETFTNVFENLNIKDSLILDRFININKILLKCNKKNNFSKWKNIVIKIRRSNRKIVSNKKNLIKYLMMMMIYSFTYLEPLKKSLNNRRDYLLGKSLFIWYRHFYCFHH